MRSRFDSFDFDPDQKCRAVKAPLALILFQSDGVANKLKQCLVENRGQNKGFCFAKYVYGSYYRHYFFYRQIM